MTLAEYLQPTLARKRAEKVNLPDYTHTHAQTEAYKRGYIQAIDEVLSLIKGFSALEAEKEEEQISLL